MLTSTSPLPQNPEVSYSQSELFKDKQFGVIQNSGCEPCLGDFGCLEVNNYEAEEELPSQLLQQLRIEEAGLMVRPNEL